MEAGEVARPPGGMSPSRSSGQLMAPALWPREEEKQTPCSGDIKEGLVLGQPDLNLKSYPSNPEAVRERTPKMLADKLTWHHLGEVLLPRGRLLPQPVPGHWRAGPRPREAASGPRPGAPAGGVPPLLSS